MPKSEKSTGTEPVLVDGAVGGTSDSTPDSVIDEGFWIQFAKKFFNKVITGKDAKILASLAEKGGVKVTRESLPLSLTDETYQKDLGGILKALLNGADSKTKELLSQFSISDFDNVISSVSPKQTDEIPSHYVGPATTFGTVNFTKEDREALWKIKKNLNVTNVHNALDLANLFHKENSSKFSRKGYLDLVSYALPADLRQAYQGIRAVSEDDVNQIFLTISTRFDSTKSEETIYLELEKLLTDESYSVLDIIDNIHSLLLHTTKKSLNELSQYCFKESMRLLNKRCSGMLVRQIKSYLMHSKKGGESFYSLHTILHTHFSEDPELTRKNVKKSVHSLETPQSSDSPAMNDVVVEFFNAFRANSQREMEAIRLSIETLENAIGNMSSGKDKSNNSDNSKSKNKGSGKCFNCGSGDHYIKQCSKPRKLRYCDIVCCVHGGHHRNSDCPLQQGPCQFAPTHVTHMQGSCRRNVRKPVVTGQNAPQYVGQPVFQSLTQAQPAQPTANANNLNLFSQDGKTFKQRLLELLTED